MTSKLTKEQIAEFREAFDLIDTNRDGTITSNELGDIMRSLGQTPTVSELKKMIDDVDSDGNGRIDFSEFLVMMSNQNKYTNKEDEMRDAFKIVDQDGNGLISAEELRRLMVNMGERVTDEELQELMREVDLDGNGQIDFYEFVKIMSSK